MSKHNIEILNINEDNKDKIKLAKLESYKNHTIEWYERNGYLPLHIAIAEENLADVIALLSIKPANKNACTNNRDNPITIAIKTGNLEILQSTVNSGAYYNTELDAPWEIASKYGKIEIIKFCIDLIPECSDKYYS